MFFFKQERGDTQPLPLVSRQVKDIVGNPERGRATQEGSKTADARRYFLASGLIRGLFDAPTSFERLSSPVMGPDRNPA